MAEVNPNLVCFVFLLGPALASVFLRVIPLWDLEASGQKPRKHRNSTPYLKKTMLAHLSLIHTHLVPHTAPRKALPGLCDRPRVSWVQSESRQNPLLPLSLGPTRGAHTRGADSVGP